MQTGDLNQVLIWVRPQDDDNKIKKAFDETLAVRKSRAPALAYLRTSSAVNVGTDKDSEKRQRHAIQGFAKRAGFGIVDEFYDAAVSGADPIETRAGFTALLDRIEGNGVRTVIVEDASRFARELMAQELGITLLISRGVRLLTASGDDQFARAREIGWSHQADLILEFSDAASPHYMSQEITDQKGTRVIFDHQRARIASEVEAGKLIRVDAPPQYRQHRNLPSPSHAPGALVIDIVPVAPKPEPAKPTASQAYFSQWQAGTLSPNGFDGK